MGSFIYYYLIDKPDAYTPDYLSNSKTVITVIFLLLYIGILIGLRKNKYTKILIAGLFICSMIELGLNMRLSLDGLDYASYSEYSVQVQEQRAIFERLREEPGELYRVESGLHGIAYPDAPLLYDYNSVTHYSSTIPNSCLTFLDKVELYTGAYTTYYKMETDTFITSLLGIKYLVSDELLSERDYTLIGTENTAQGNVYLYRNPYYLPLGFCVSPDAEGAALPDRKEYEEAADYGTAQNHLIRTLAGEDLGDVYDENGNVCGDIWERYRSSLLGSPVSNMEKSGSRLSCIADNSSDVAQLLLFTVPYDKGWKAEIDGVDTTIRSVFGTLMAVMLEPGTHRIDLTYRAPYMREGFIVSCISWGLLGCGLLLKKRKKSIEG